MANLDLDIDFNGLDNDILQKRTSQRKDIYPRVVRYASSKGVSRRKVDDMMLEMAGGYGYSNFDEASIKKEAEAFCEAQYEECVKQNKGEFGDCGNQLQPCKDKYLADKLKALKKTKNKNFWNNLLTGINTVGQQLNQQNNTNTNTNTSSNNNFRDDSGGEEDDTETRILGMKPLVFTVVALGTVTTLAIVTVMLMRKKKGK